MSVSVLPAQLGQDSQGCRHTVVARPDSAPFTITVVQNTVAAAYANDAPESSCCPTLLIRFEVVAGPFAANFDERNRPLSIQDAKALYAAAEAPGGQCEAQLGLNVQGQKRLSMTEPTHYVTPASTARRCRLFCDSAGRPWRLESS